MRIGLLPPVEMYCGRASASPASAEPSAWLTAMNSARLDNPDARQSAIDGGIHVDTDHQ